MFANLKFNEDVKLAYEELNTYTKALISTETNKHANLANIVSLLNYFLTDINWVGFYFYEQISNELVLSHFNGLPACTRIKINKGVCGKAFSTKSALVVADVSKFDDHIVCDAATKSELVIPIIIDNRAVGVLDIDSPSLNRFDELDKEYMQKFVKEVIEEKLKDEF